MDENRTQLSPQEVKRKISADFKIQGITYIDAAKQLGNISPKTLYNLLSTKQYFSPKQAERFHMAFDYRTEFLTQGEGNLREEPKQGDSKEPTPNLTQLLNQLPTKDDGIAMIDLIETALKKKNHTEYIPILTESRNFINTRNDVIEEMKSENHPEEELNLLYLQRMYSRKIEIMHRIKRLIDNL